MIIQEQLLIHPKRIIEDHLRFKIPTNLTPKSCWEENKCTWEELLNVKGPLPTDVVEGISWDDDTSDVDGAESILILVVLRQREETDEEYLKRLDEIAAFEKSAEDYEKREYKRLKAKYENI